MKERLDASCDWPTLPPPEYRLYDPRHEGRIPTPLDQRGLVDVTALIETTLRTVDSSFSWQSSFNDVHHLQWPSRSYDSLPGSTPNPQEFRNLAISKVETPRTFHNWIHCLTEPPPIPSDEVMRLRIEAQRVVMALFKSVRQGKRLTRSKKMTEDQILEGLVRCFDDFSKNHDAVMSLPPEFRPNGIAEQTPQNIEDMFAMSRPIGRIAIVSSIVRRIEAPQVGPLLVAV